MNNQLLVIVNTKHCVLRKSVEVLGGTWFNSRAFCFPDSEKAEPILNRLNNLDWCKYTLVRVGADTSMEWITKQ